MYKSIRDYAIIGNRRSVALVGIDGSIDWAPAPFLDSPSVFSALLDTQKGGCWGIAPVQPFSSKQEYIRETNILSTVFETAQGTAELVDWMPIQEWNREMFRSHRNWRGSLRSEDEEILEIYRKVACVKGVCKLRVTFSPKPDYGRGEVKLFPIQNGVVFKSGKKNGVLISKASYRIHDGEAIAEIELQEGESQYFIFRYSTIETHPSNAEYYEREFRNTKRYWEDWVHRCDLEACLLEYPWHDYVSRSLLVLKLLFMEPPGSIAAAATASLPEKIGGVRNWDYRFSWIRDSAFTLQALFWSGHLREANEYARWLLSECRNISDNPEDLQILYGLRGQTEAPEYTLDHLEGYRGSKPVRIGNAAHTQRQWDVYGGILNMVWELHKRGSHVVDSELWDSLRVFANYVVDVWREPDEGLWEVRGGTRHFVHSKVMCWVALDRAVKLARAHGLDGETKRWEREAEEIRRAIMAKGWSERKQSFVRSFDSEDMDASLLLLPVLGFIDGNDERMRSTIECIEKELSVGNGLLLRYTSGDGLPGSEGAFLLASFWLVDALVLSSQRDRASALFEQLLGYANRVKLFSEEIDPETEEFLGNFPQAYTHIGLINSAFLLSLTKESIRELVS